MRTMVAVLTLILAATCLAQSEEDYLPLKEGWRWTYEVREVANVGGMVVQKRAGTLTCTCRGKERIGDEEFAILEWSGEGAGAAARQKVWVSSGGARVVVAKSSSSEFWIVPADFAKKTSEATVTSEDGTVKVESAVGEGEEDVETPAGKFRCAKVTADVAVGTGVKAQRIVWYAKGIGIVKVVKRADVGGGVRADKEIVLTKLEKGEGAPEKGEGQKGK